MAIHDRTEVGGVTAVGGGANLQVQLFRVVEDATRSGVTEIARTPYRFTVDREMPDHGAPEGGWPSPMARLDGMLGVVPEGWSPLSDEDREHVRRMAQAAWGTP